MGEANAGFSGSPAAAIFFNDDQATRRGEQLTAVVEAVRISNISRSPAEIEAVQNNR